MAKKPPACTHSTSMMPPMKLDMSNLAWENFGDELVLLPSPRGGKRRDDCEIRLKQDESGEKKSHSFFEKAV